MLNSRAVEFSADDVVQCRLYAESSDVLRLAGASSSPAELVGLAAPTGASSAANKTFVESVAHSLPSKLSVFVASTTNVESPVTHIDGQVIANKRVLLKNQSSTYQNGIYLAVDGYLTRASDLADGSNASGAQVYVTSGSSAGKTYVCANAAGTDVVGTDGLSWASESSGGGNAADETTIQLTGNQFSVKDAGVTNTKLAAATDTTDATSASTGAFVTAGGVGVAKNVHAGVDVVADGKVYALSTADASSATTGSLITSGGIGVAKKGYFGDQLNAQGSIAATSTTTGSVVVTGGIGVSSDGWFGGDVHAVAHYTTSDERFKTNVVPIEDALEKVCNIQGVTFDWVADGSAACGIIAQQMLPIIPLAVNTKNQEKFEVDYSRVVPYLVEAVKTLKRELDEERASKRPRKHTTE